MVRGPLGVRKGPPGGPQGVRGKSCNSKINLLQMGSDAQKGKRERERESARERQKERMKSMG